MIKGVLGNGYKGVQSVLEVTLVLAPLLWPWGRTPQLGHNELQGELLNPEGQPVVYMEMLGGAGFAKREERKGRGGGRAGALDSELKAVDVTSLKQVGQLRQGRTRCWVTPRGGHFSERGGWGH